MKITSTISRIEGKADKPQFPALYRATNRDYTVLFYKEDAGVVVQVGLDAPYSIGHHSQAWVSCFSITHWTPLTPGESITLTVE